MKLSRLLLPAIIVLSIFASSCNGVRPECINEDNKDLIIRWGEQDIKNGLTLAYQVNTEASVFSYNKKGSNVYLKEIGELEPDKYCKMVRKIKKAMLKTQALSVPADTVRFVEFINPKMRAEMRVFWNPQFQTHGSAMFREIYDSLETYIAAFK